VFVSSPDGVTAPGHTSLIAVTFDSAGMQAPQSRTGKLCVRSSDPATPVVEVPLTLQATCEFRGFFGAAKDAMNKANAGATVPVQFSLGGDQGLAVFAARDGNAVRLMGKRGGKELEVATGTYDPEAEVITLVFPTRGGSYGFVRD
jgi:hypothetical protein